MAVLPDAVVEVPPPEDSPANPRRWLLVATVIALIAGLLVIVAATRPNLPANDWERGRGPTGPINLDSLVTTNEGFAVLSGMTIDGVLLWSSSDGLSWDYRPLQGSPSQLAAIGNRLVAYGANAGRILTPEGDIWVESEAIVFPDEVRSDQGSGRPSLIAGENGLIVMSILGDVWWSADGSEFDLVVADPEWGPGQTVEVPYDSACRPPTTTSPDVPPVVATESGFTALVSSNLAEPFGVWPVCEPESRFSRDGRSWKGTGEVLGDGAYVYNMAWRDGRFTAVGGRGIGRPVAWTSGDGQAWEPIDTFGPVSGVDLYTVQAGPAGWVILGRESEGSNAVGWTSSDGLCWSVLPQEIDGAEAAVSQDHIMIVDRVTYPQTWMASPTGDTGSC
jgi:hypothetical protein